MKRLSLFAIIPILLLLVTGWVTGQQNADTFELVRQIGRVPPQNVVYDPNFDQFALTDERGRLLLVDAATYTTKHILYPNGEYNDYVFSHDGRYLALAIELRMEVWNTQTGERDLVQETPFIRITGPLLFSDDDTLLLYNAVVPAPDDIKRFEGDTSNVPWLWELEAARGNRTSILSEQNILNPFFERRNGLILAPNNVIISAIPSFIEIRNIAPEGYPIQQSIETARFERDPMDLWFGLNSEQIYFRELNGSGLYQIDTRDNSFRRIQPGAIRTTPSLQIPRTPQDFAAPVHFGDVARIIGEPTSLRSNAFLTLLLGEDYHQAYGNRPITVMLLDVLQPVTVSQDQKGFLIYIFDENAAIGTLDFLRPVDIRDFAMHPDGKHVVVRRAAGAQAIEVYDLETGNLDLSIIPDFPSADGTAPLLTYNQDGSVIISDWQRFDAETGAILNQVLDYRPGFDDFFFSADGERLITRNGRVYSDWEVATGERVRQEVLEQRDNLLDRSPDGRRFLYGLASEDGQLTGVEVVDLGTEERQLATFNTLPGRPIERVIPSPDWQHYLVVYRANSESEHAPNNEAAIYSLSDGQQWFLAGADLPAPGQHVYDWLDNNNALIASFNPNRSQPDRIYGLEYHPSGVPQCLVDAFPTLWQDLYLDLFERLNAQLTPEALSRLTVALCEAAPSGLAVVQLVISPEPAPTRPYLTPTPSFVAGLPACLSSRFPSEAAQYAREWRMLTENLTPEQVLELQDLLCEGIREGLQDIPSPARASADENVPDVMTINVITGNRTRGSFVPDIAPPEEPPFEEETVENTPIPDSVITTPTPSPTPGVAVPEITGEDEDPILQLVLDEFREREGYRPSRARISLDGRLLAVQTPSNHVAIFRLARPYTELFIDAQATADAARRTPADTIALAASPTAPFDGVGQPRPTLTPTITPTSPPTPGEIVEQERYGEVIDLCDHTRLYHPDDLPADYAPGGRLLVEQSDSRALWLYDPVTSAGQPDETLPNPEFGLLSFDGEWLLRTEPTIVVSEVDGANPVVLFEAAEAPVFPNFIDWLNPDVVQYTYSGYISGERGAQSLRREYNVNTQTLSEPLRPRPQPEINELDASIIVTQPAGGSLAVVNLGFDAGLVRGRRYYIYDYNTQTADYFARLADGSEITFEWHPLGRVLYYRYPNNPDWNVYDPETEEHRVLGDYPGGQWSRDGRYRVQWGLPSTGEITQRLEEDLPIPKMQIWDSQTGLIRRYCMPETGTPGIEARLFWSPDNSYLAFQYLLPTEANIEFARPRTFILDTETGSVTEIGYEIDRILLWID